MRKKKNKKIEEIFEEETHKLKTETLQAVIAIIFFAVAIFLILASFKAGGMAGEKIYSVLHTLLGVGYFLTPTVLGILGYSYLREHRPNFAIIKASGSLLLFLSSLGVIDLIFKDMGGILGGFISTPIFKLFDFYFSLVFLGALILISFLIIFDTKIIFQRLMFWKYFAKKEDLSDDDDDEEILESYEIDKIPEETEEEEPEEEIKKEKKVTAENTDDDFEKNVSSVSFLSKKALEYFGRKPTLPPLSLLQKDKGKPEVGDIKANSNIIKRTLRNFGINVEMDEVSIGPSVTRYALKPAQGIKLSKIVGLQNDLSLALAAHPLRIEAPIPGKSLVGIEIPNTTRTLVGLATLFAEKDFRESDKLLTVALGKDISGKAHFVNLAKAPHMLIAGSTGSGKSVTIHALITSLLYKATPDALKFIMIDPKRVELTQYKNIPHLLTPVITDAKKAILALKWAIKEMDRRYDILETATVRDIQSYHKNVVSPIYDKASKENLEETELPDPMPYIVIVIDELADIMQSYPRELEAAIVRLAQMSRAIGIHLVLSTQRPSVNVITGLIKANVPTRVALQVASQVDSRTILDMSGAEKLLGAGDMLYLSGEMSKPTRIQSAFISEKELKDVTNFLRNTYKDEIPEEIDINSAEKDKNMLFDSLSAEDTEDDDPLYEEAKTAVLEAGKASTSYIQRKLRVGYARAARLMDALEDNSIIGPADGSKAREVLIKADEVSRERSQPEKDSGYLTEKEDYPSHDDYSEKDEDDEENDDEEDRN
ncbi:MAG: DNA translocase FtsK 4TM domain-containing protein [Patescibacteria group bacterium]